MQVTGLKFLNRIIRLLLIGTRISGMGNYNKVLHWMAVLPTWSIRPCIFGMEESSKWLISIGYSDRNERNGIGRSNISEEDLTTNNRNRDFRNGTLKQNEKM